MTTQNITQLTPQTGSADPTSLLYAVTGVGTFSDTGLPLSVFVHSLGLTGVPTTPTATTGTNTTQIASTAFVQAQLTSTLAAYAPLASPTFTGTVTIPGGTINNTSVGATTASTGAFTTLSASGTVSGAGFTTLLAPYAPLASPTFTGTVVIPTITLSGGTINGTSVGATTASTGAFTTLSASSTVSGTGFSTYLASPPAIGGTTPASGAFTTLTSSTNSKVEATNSSAQSIPNNATTVVTGWTATTNVGSNFNASTGVFTAPATGTYFVSAAVEFPVNSWTQGNNISIIVMKNGSVTSYATGIVAQVTGSYALFSGTVAVIVALNSSDTISIGVYQNRGSATALNNANNYLTIARLP